MATPTLALIPTGYKAGKLYSVLPESGVGDFTVVRATEATRVNEEGLIETMGANVPRLDYSGGGCPVLLTEPQRTNRMPNSEDGSTWALSNITLSSLSGGLNKEYYEITSLGNTGRFDVVLNNWVNLTAGTYTSSVFAKKGTSDEIILTTRANFSSQDTYSVFNLTSGTVVSNSGIVGSIVPYSDGWFRCSITFTNSGGYTNFASFAFGFNFNSSNTDTLFVASPQSEIGSYPTSYIKTEGSAVTRNADQVNGAGDAATFNDSEGVLMAEIAALTEVGDGTTRLSISDGSQDNNITIGYSATNTLRTIIRSGASNQALMTSSQTITNYLKVVVKYKANDFALWVNGFEVATDTSGSAPVGLSELSFDRGDAALPFYGKAKQLQYFNAALTDSELEKLTSWTSFIEMAQAQNYNII